jgi:small subunit ribosomal protein S16
MATKIRLQRHGRKKRAFFHIVVADSRAPRDGRFIDKIGTYNPITNPATIDINLDKAVQWMANGAQPSDTARAILSYKGVLYKHHLQVGVRKGAITQEQADAKFAEWMTSKEAKIAEKRSNLEKASNSRKSDAMKAEAQKREAIAARVLAKQNSVSEEAVEETESNETEATAEVTENVAAEETSSEETAAEETVAEETAAEEPAAEESAPEEGENAE